MNMRHPIRGLLIGPLVAPFAYWVFDIAHGLAIGLTLDADRAVSEFSVIAKFGLPLVYAFTLVWMAPILYGLHRLRWLRASTLTIAGALGGTVGAILLNISQQEAFIQVLFPWTWGLVIGALVGCAIWWIGRGRVESSGPTIE